MSDAKARRKAPRVRLEVEDNRLDQIERDVADLREQLARLIDVLTEKPDEAPRRVKLTPAQLQAAARHKAFCMRQGKAARRLGLTRVEFAEIFGDDVDFMPADAEDVLRRAKKRPRRTGG